MAFLDTYKEFTIRDIELVWAAGYMENTGHFTSSGATTRYVLASRINHQGVLRLAEIFGVRATKRMRNGIEEMTLTVSGDKLHRFMKLIWPYMTKKRRYSYYLAREKARQRMEKMNGS